MFSVILAIKIEKKYGWILMFIGDKYGNIIKTKLHVLILTTVLIYIKTQK